MSLGVKLVQARGPATQEAVTEAERLLEVRIPDEYVGSSSRNRTVAGRRSASSPAKTGRSRASTSSWEWAWKGTAIW
jgi:hypothetical protein